MKNFYQYPKSSSRVCVLLFFLLVIRYNVSAQSYKQLEGNLELSPELLDEENLFELFGHNLQTRVTVLTPDGIREFMVRPSSHVVSGNKDEVYYEGVSTEGKSDQLFIQVDLKGITLDFLDPLKGKQFTLARKESLQKASFQKVMNESLKSKGQNSHKEIEALYSKSAGQKYSWIDQKAVQEIINKYAPSDKKLQCGVDSEKKPSKGPNSTQEKVNNYTVGGNIYTQLGYIGKRDIFLYLYNYDNQVSDFDMSQNITNINYSLSSFTTFNDLRMENTRLVITKNAVSITTQSLPWESGEITFLNNFKTYIQNTANANVQAYRPMGRPLGNNVRHLLISKDHWDKAYGFTDPESVKFAIAMSYSEGTREYTTAAHEFGHMLGAFHTNPCSYVQDGIFYDDLMAVKYQICPRKAMHTVASSRDNINQTIDNISLLDEIIPDRITILPSIVNGDYSQELLETGYDTRNQGVYIPESLIGNFFHNTMRMFEGQINREGALSSNGGDKLAVYKVKFPSYAYYQLKIIDANYDTYLYLLDKNGKLIASDNDGAGNLRSYISGYFNNDWYYVIVGGYNNNGGFSDLKIRYGWWQEGEWKSANQGVAGKNAIPGETLNLDRGDGNIIMSADFGLNSKDKILVEETKFLNRIYPNPVTQDILYLSSEVDGLKICKIYDLSGKLVKTTEFIGKQGVISIPHSLADGHYVLSVIDTESGSKQTYHMILQRQ